MTVLPKTYTDLEDYEAGFKDGRNGGPAVPPPFANQRAYLDGYDDGLNVNLQNHLAGRR